MLKKMLKYEARKKVSFDLTEENYNTLTSFSEELYVTNSSVINTLISRFINIPDYVKAAFCRACLEEIKKEKDAYSNLEAFDRITADKRIYNYEAIFHFFGGEKFFLKETSAMKKIPLQDGCGYIPDNWIQLNMKKNGNYIGVIEVQNSKEYNIPHFFFIWDVPINKIERDSYDEIYYQCQKMFPEFKKIINMQINPIYDKDGSLLNGELLRRAPLIGIFSVGEYGKETSYPYNAMIVRKGIENQNCTSDEG